MNRSRPSRRGVLVTTAAGASVLLAVAAGQVWARSGSPWLWLLAVGLIATAALDGLWSWWAMRHVELVVDSIADGRVATPFALRVDVRAPRAPVRLRASTVTMTDGRVVASMSTPVAVVGPAGGELSITVAERGRVRELTFDVVCTAPLGLIGVRRVVIATVDAPVAVGPESWPEPVQAPGEALGADPAAGRATELTRGVRPLVTGDGHRIVHWPATARVGRLMVREFDVPQPALTVVVLDLGPHPSAAGEVAVRQCSRWIADQLLAQRPVELVTMTPDAIVRAPVRDVAVLNARLADAVPGVLPGFDDAVRFGPAVSR